MSVQNFSDQRKIDPSQGERLVDGSLNDNNRIEIGHTTGLCRMGASGVATSGLIRNARIPLETPHSAYC